MSDASLHAIVHGRVQGVGFRYFVVTRARALGVTATARNLADGTVEVYAEGERAVLAQLERELRRGPPAADVSRVEARYGAARGDTTGFDVS
jgi:acylphosphatase